MVMALSLCHRPSHEPPVIVLFEPANNPVVPKVVRVRALVSTRNGINEARLYVDRKLELKETGGPDSILTFIWSAGEMAPWSRHSILVEVTDNDSLTGCSDSVIVTITGISGPTYHDGPINKDQTWHAAGSPHVVGANLDVEAVLTIEPGSLVEFSSGGRILIGNGALIAQGGSSMITFTGQDTIPGSWKSIEFSARARPDRSVLDNCLIEYGGGSGDSASIVVNAPVRIDDCVIRQSATAGVRVPEAGFLSFSRNVLSDNRSAALAIDPMLVPSIGDGNRFSGNNPDAIAIVGTDITRDTRWNDQGVPYLVEDCLYVQGNGQLATLSIGPGTTVLFSINSNGGILADTKGAVVADGSSGIVILKSQDPYYWWGGIEFEGDGSPVVQGVFKNCLIQDADNQNGAAVVLQRAVIEMENSVISGGGWSGIACYDGGHFAGFRNNVITGCAAEAMAIEMEWVPTIGDGNSFTGNAIYQDYHDGIALIADDIVSSATWRDLGVPYIAAEEISLDDRTGTPPVLTIAPGVRLEFLEAAIDVESGALIADGTGGRITFTRYSNSEPWDGIYLRSTPDAPQSILRDCLIEYAGFEGGNVMCDSCAPIIEGNEISHSSQFGILLHHSELNPDSLLAENRFHDNDSGDVGVRPESLVSPQPQKVRSTTPHNPRPRELRNHPPGPHLRREVTERVLPPRTAPDKTARGKDEG